MFAIFSISPIVNLKEGIRNGKYKEVHPWISKTHCPIEKVEIECEPLTVALIHFGEFVTLREVYERTHKRHCRAGSGAYLLGLGAAYPLEQYNFPIISLGSIFKNRHDDDCVLYIYKNLVTGKRTLGLWALKNGFHDLFRFIVLDAHRSSIMELL